MCALMQIYASLLAGFLVTTDPSLKETLIAQLSSGSIQPVIEGVQNCLEFYLSTGAITGQTEKSLRDVLTALVS